MQKRKDGEFLTPVDKTLLKLKTKRGKIPFDFLTAKESLPLRKQGMISFDEKRKTWIINSKGKERMKLLEGNTSKAINIILESLLMESGHNSLLLLDIDDTLLEARNIYIYYFNRSDFSEEEVDNMELGKLEGNISNRKIVKLSPKEFGEKTPKAERQQGKEFSFREFRNSEKVENSIETGIPLLPNLAKVNSYIQNGWTIGILTARGMEEVIGKAMRIWLKKMRESGHIKGTMEKLLQRAPWLDEKYEGRKLVYAVGDETQDYAKGDSDAKKANVVLKLATSGEFDRVWLYDDDKKNLDAVNNLIDIVRKKDPKAAQRIKAMPAV